MAGPPGTTDAGAVTGAGVDSEGTVEEVVVSLVVSSGAVASVFGRDVGILVGEFCLLRERGRSDE